MFPALLHILSKVELSPELSLTSLNNFFLTTSANLLTSLNLPLNLFRSSYKNK
ncbi:hypothetical protein PR001_g29413 [Phytophthora rubi]|uniref:Uncharacterized protein n=1 Tax=Phytophthora rubi TaxID=129364 RepID=A0A6A3H2P0_9STRA|nr:hypothetical protein PR001_g29413 [Phytophthora rubi]